MNIKPKSEKRKTHVVLDTVHDVAWRYKKGHPKRTKVESECEQFLLPIPHLMMPVIINWSNERGFGSYSFWMRDGVLYCDSECDSRESVLRVMQDLVESAVFVDHLPVEEHLGCWPENDEDLDREIYPEVKKK